MRFLVDECAPRHVIEGLAQAGHDVVTCVKGADDNAVLARAAEEGRVLVTADHDFGSLVFDARRRARAVVLLRLEGLPPAARAVRLIAALDALGDDIDDAFVVIEPERVRRRPLPRDDGLG